MIHKLMKIGSCCFSLLFMDGVRAETAPFSMAFMADSQIPWGCASEGTVSGDYCSNPYNREPFKNTGYQANETNLIQVAAMKMVPMFDPTPFKGVVINGDITATSNMTGTGELSTFWAIYQSLYQYGWIWPGLGNHDYQNFIDDCGGGNGSPTRNYCSAEMMQWMASYVVASYNAGKANASLDLPVYSTNPGQTGGERNMTGSLSYSWDIGDFHFVQFNNYPTYYRSFTRGYSSGVNSWEVIITPPTWTWMYYDLLQAHLAGKKIILNWHDYYDVYSDNASAHTVMLRNMLAPYASSIKAIFVGHHHYVYGYTTDLDLGNNMTVPVIHSGSPLFSRFIKANFSNDANGCQIKTSIINSYQSYYAAQLVKVPIPNPPTKQSSYINGDYTINCN